MRFFGFLLIVGMLVVTGDVCSQDVSGTFKLKKGGEVTGMVKYVSGAGIIFKKKSGSNTSRYEFREFDEESLKKLIKHPKVRQYAGGLLGAVAGADGGSAVALPPPPKQEALDSPTVGKVEDRPALPEPRNIFGALFGTGAGWIMLLTIWAGNIWAGYHIGIYRRWNKWMVPGIAAVAPILAPIAFISMKPKKFEKKGGEAQEEDDGKPAKKKGAAVARPVAKAKVVTARPGGGAAAGAARAGGAAPAAGGGAPIAAPKAGGAPEALEAVAYVKGEVNINKRFVETKFAPFFKLVPDEPYRSGWLCFVTTRGEFWAKRIPKITQTDVTIQCPQEGGGTIDQVCQIADIKEIHIRPPE